MMDPDRNQPDDLFGALTAVDALDKFLALPPDEQDRFSAWIAKSQDIDAYWRRIDILVLAMRMAPSVEAERSSPPHHAGFWTNPIGRV